MDGKYRFMDITVGWPGSVHDARVFTNSDIYYMGQTNSLFSSFGKMLEGVEIPVHIIGDPAYPLLKWLMKAYNDTGRLAAEQLTFNYRLSRARNVENAFDRLIDCKIKDKNINFQVSRLLPVGICSYSLER